MKYEAVFGDQSLFDGCIDEFAYLVIKTSYGQKFTATHETINGVIPDYIETCGLEIAMRSIIKEPKRWTWEDKKVGRLPEVGSIFTYRDETLTCHFIDGDGEIWAHDIDNKIVTPLLRDCKPIETPREKYDRERDECIDKLLAKMPPSPITVVSAMKIVYEELRPFTGGDHD